MLILSRKQGERIVIGEGITVMVLETRGDRVRLGFSAPADVRINRHEVAMRIEQEEARKQSREQLATA